MPSLTHTFKDLPILPWAARDNELCSTSFACDLFALPSLDQTLKNLPLPPMGNREWRVTQYPFCMWSFGLWSFGSMSSSLTHTLKDLLVSCKVGASNLTCLHKDGDNHTSQRQDNHTSQRRGNHQHHSTRANPHKKTHKLNIFKIYSLLPSTFIRYFNNQISTIFSKPSKAFLVNKIFYYFSKYHKSSQDKTSLEFANNAINL